MIFLVTLLPITILVPGIGWKAYDWMLDSSLEIQAKELQKVREHIAHDVENLVVRLRGKSEILAQKLNRAAGNRSSIDRGSLSRSIDSLFDDTESLRSITLFGRDGLPLVHRDRPSVAEGIADSGGKERDFPACPQDQSSLCPCAAVTTSERPIRERRGRIL